MFGVPTIDAAILAEWRGFFGMVAGAAAGLAGLVFVALSLHLPGIRADPPDRYRARSSLASMMAVFVLASLVLLPRQPSTWVGLEALGVIGADGAFLIWSFRRARTAVAHQPGGQTRVQPYQRRTTLAVGLALIGMGSAALVGMGQEAGFYGLAAFSMVTMVWVVINTWALVLGITDDAEGSNGAARPAPAPDRREGAGPRGAGRVARK